MLLITVQKSCKNADSGHIFNVKESFTASVAPPAEGEMAD